MSKFSEFLYEKRKEKGVTLREMSKELNISISYLSDLENGNKFPPNSSKKEHKNLINKIVNYLDLSEQDRLKCLELADNELVKQGHVSNDITDYMKNTPNATLALRTAKEKNISDEEWLKIVNKIKQEGD